MVRREQNSEILNRIANDPAVLPFTRMDDQPWDFSPVEGKRLTELGGVMLSNGEDAVGVFIMTAPGLYQAHTLFGPTCRGRKAIEVAREMLAWLFAHNADMIWGKTPRWNKAACLFNRLVGAREFGGDEFEAYFSYRKAA